MPSEDPVRPGSAGGRSSGSTASRPPAYGPAHRELFERFKAALNRGEIRAAEPDAASPTGWRVNPWVKQGILAGFRMGEVVDMSVGGPSRRPPPLPRQVHLSAAAARPGRRRPRRPRRLGDPRRLLSRPRGDLHAADVRQRRRLGGRGHDDRLARPGGELRPGRQAGPPLGRRPARRRAGAGGRLAGDRRGRRPDRRQLRRLRRDGGQAPRRARRGDHPHPLDPGLRPGPRDDPPRGPRARR